MAETLVLIRAAFRSETDLEHVRHYYEQAWKALREVDGYCGGGVWKDVKSGHQVLVLYVYRSQNAADAGLKVVTEAPLLVESQSITLDPPDVMRVRVIESGGTLKDHPTEPDFISLSIRVADPGKTEELVEDLRVVFGESTSIPGFSGYLIGSNETLEEEVVGLASWSAKEAFLASLPKPLHHDVRLFERPW